MIHESYILLQINLEVYFISLKRIDGSEFFTQKVDLKLNQGSICSLHQTINPSHAQFTYTDDHSHHHSWIFTWDLGLNSEQSVTKVGEQAKHGSLNQIYKGAAAHNNYFISKRGDQIFDLRYECPLNVFDGALANQFEFDSVAVAPSGSQQKRKLMNIGEIKLAGDASMMLGVSVAKGATLQVSYNAVNLAYMEYIMEKIAHSHHGGGGSSHSHGDLGFKLILESLRFTYQGENPLHFFATNEDFLGSFMKAVQSHLQDSDDTAAKEAVQNFISYIIFCNLRGKDPLSLAIKKYSTQCIETML